MLKAKLNKRWHYIVAAGLISLCWVIIYIFSAQSREYSIQMQLVFLMIVAVMIFLTVRFIEDVIDRLADRWRVNKEEKAKC